jgi:hypothetical protein
MHPSGERFRGKKMYLNTLRACPNNPMMAERQKYKARFTSKLPNGDFLGLTVWPGKSDPTAEVLTIQIRHQGSTGWETVHRVAIYRTSDGRYSLLPERTPSSQPAKSEPVGGDETGESFE